MSEWYKKIVNLCHGKLDMALGQLLNLDTDIRKKYRIHQIFARILSKKYECCYLHLTVQTQFLEKFVDSYLQKIRENIS